MNDTEHSTPRNGGTTAATEHGTCPVCTLPRTPADVAGLAWSSQHEPDGSITWICPTCTRTQLWQIEALLAVTSSRAPAAPNPARRAA